MRRLMPMVLLLGVALAACSDGDATDDAGVARTSVTAGGADAEQSAPEAEQGAPDAGGAAGSSVGDEAGDPAGDGLATEDAALRPAAQRTGRRVIRTAEIELESRDPDRTVDDVMRLAERRDGFVATTELRRDEDDRLRGTVTLRVPSDDLLPVLAELEELAVRAPVSRVDEEDVTAEAVDLEARLANLTRYEDELRTLLSDVREDTSSPDDLLRIFERIREVRGEIDGARARLDTIADRVSLATVEVRIAPTGSAGPLADPTWRPVETVREAVAAATRGLTRVADVAIWLAVGVLPVLLALAAPVVAGALAWRRLRRPSAEAPGPAEA